MRVGANARQFARIKRLHAEGMTPSLISKTVHLTEQSLEKILAALDGRPEVTLALENNPEVNAIRLENQALAARLAKYEDPVDVDAERKTEEEEDLES